MRVAIPSVVLENAWIRKLLINFCWLNSCALNLKHCELYCITVPLIVPIKKDWLQLTNIPIKKHEIKMQQYKESTEAQIQKCR